MRLRPLRPDGPRPKRRRLLTIQVLPTLITAGNLIMGVLAIAYLIDAGAASADEAEALFVKAAWLIFIGMFLDTLDGRIARMTGTTSDFGAQLDSLADVVSFGVAPALLAKSLLGSALPAFGSKFIFSLCLVYVLGAALRLARYNVESERMSSAGSLHVTRVFRGLPSPAAAGVIAALVLLRNEYAVHGPVDWAMVFCTPLLGMLMVSRMPYSHLMNRYFDSRNAQPVMIVMLALLVYLVIAHFIETVTGLFVIYAALGPFLMLTNRWFGWPAWAVYEDDDEEALAVVDEQDEDPTPDDPRHTGTEAPQ
jgi:CDP-diacylglycerol--serine O-phosphatidyltransferase